MTIKEMEAAHAKLGVSADELQQICEEAALARSPAQYTMAICATLASVGCAVWKVGVEVCRRLEAKP